MKEMNTYYVGEAEEKNQYVTSEAVKCSSLRDAKRIASKMQFFCGTIMIIATQEQLFNDIDIAGKPSINSSRCLAYKERGKWKTPQQIDEWW